MPDISASIGSEDNQLLQNEVATLTHDMHSLSERLQNTQEGEIFLYYRNLFVLLLKHGISSCSATCANAGRIRCQADFNSFRLEKWGRPTNWMPLYYVDEDYPAGSGIIEPFPEQCN